MESVSMSDALVLARALVAYGESDHRVSHHNACPPEGPACTVLCDPRCTCGLAWFSEAYAIAGPVARRILAAAEKEGT